MGHYGDLYRERDEQALMDRWTPGERWTGRSRDERLWAARALAAEARVKEIEAALRTLGVKR